MCGQPNRSFDELDQKTDHIIYYHVLFSNFLRVAFEPHNCHRCHCGTRDTCSTVLLHLYAEMFQKQPSGGVFRNRCSENMQPVYRRTHIPKYDFVTQLNWNHTSAWVLSLTPFLKIVSWGLRLVCLRTYQTSTMYIYNICSRKKPSNWLTQIRK